MRHGVHLPALVMVLALMSPIATAQVDCAMIGGEVHVIESGTAGAPSLVWTGSEYGMTWIDWRDGNEEIYFVRLDATGTAIGPEIRVTTALLDSHAPSLVWTGSEFGLAWTDERHGATTDEIYFARLDATGTKIGEDVRITMDVSPGSRATSPSLVWTGTEYGLAWHGRHGYTTYEIYFTRIDAAGNKIGGDTLISEDGVEHETYASLVWTGTEYGLAFAEGFTEGIFFTRISAAGVEIGDEVHATSPDGQPTFPSLEWTGSDYGLAFQTFSRAPQTEIWITRLDATGNVVGEERQLVNDMAGSYRPELAWSGSEFGLLWRDYDRGVPETKFTNLDSTMGDISEDVELVSGEDYAASQPLAWADGEYGVAWAHYRDLPWPEGSDGRIRFGRVVCGCLAGVDPDDDGIGMPCDNCPDDANTDQSDADRDGIGDICDPCTDIDRDGFGDPDFPQNQCDTDNCPEIPNPDQTDVDEDGYGLVCDCDDTEAAVNSGHAEHNDGLDNDCDELVDEGSVEANFCCDGGNPSDCTRRFCWPAQEGATLYEVLRAEDRQLSSGCESSFTAQTEWDDPAEPDATEIYYYLHRPAEPLPGSWGAQTPSPYERDPICLP